MEEQKEIGGVLELILQPAFCVKGGIILRLNQAARKLLIEPGTPAADLLGDDAEEYKQFQSGCLYLTLNIAGQCFGASVTRMDDYDVFMLEQDSSQVQLRTMELVAMEMRLPLSNITNTADQLFPTLENLNDPVIRTSLAKINQGLNQLHRMVSNMSYAFQYTAEPAPRMNCRDICAVLSEIFEHAQSLACRKNVTLRYTGPNESILCLINEERLERAVYNMLSNAMKFAPEGGRIDAKLTRRGKKLYLSVRDNGSGIPKSFGGNIFNRYQRQPGLEDSRFGLGLGMVLLYTAASAHGGTVLITQPEGGGTQVTMSIAIRNDRNATLRSDRLQVDYAGGRDRGLIELSDVLPSEMYTTNPE